MEISCQIILLENRNYLTTVFRIF
jgi:hypothetical protein